MTDKQPEALEAAQNGLKWYRDAHPGDDSGADDGMDAEIEQALTALSELERMAGEPVSHATVAGALFDFMGWLTSRRARLVLSSVDNAAPAADAIKEFAAMRGLSINDAQVQTWKEQLAIPPAQQTVTNDEQASAYMDARLWEFIDMAGAWPTAKPDPRIWAHVMVYEPPAQQPQAEPFGYVSQHTNGSWEFSPTPAGVYPDTAKSITAVYTKQPQARADLEAENARLREALEHIGQYTGEGPISTPWRDIVKACGEKARAALENKP